ncbi:MAG: peptidylprolyl isomerase [Terracidiphilus sp.]|nr:peptidylprolyl isomerase [Terracidiphilus sp.]
MTQKLLSIPAAIVMVTALLASSATAQTRATAPASPYGGETVAEIIARVNDQVITNMDYDRAMKELDQEERQRGASRQDISAAHRDLLRNLIDQQLWLSKGKELGVTGETELINRLNEIRKQYNLSTLEDLEKAAQDQGVSYEDFKANIRNTIVTQQVMRQEVGNRISVTPGEVQRYFEQHKQEYAQQESVQLGEILVSTAQAGDDAQKLAEAQTKANEIAGKLHAGGDFAQLAKAFSDGTTASTGGELGTYKRGQLAKVFEDQVFTMKAGEFTEPIRTKQGFIIFKVIARTQGGVPAYKDVQQDVEQSYFMAKMEPAIRDYLTKMREDAHIDIKPGYEDTGASTNKRVLPIAYSAYAPPTPKKKRKVERTRFRETEHGFRQKATPVAATTDAAVPAPAASTPAAGTKSKKKVEASLKPGKKEKIRFGKAPQETLPNSPTAQTEDAGAITQQTTAAQAMEPENPLEAQPEKKKSRFSERARLPKQPKKSLLQQQQKDAITPVAPDTAEVADRQTQLGALGLKGDTTKKKKKGTSTGEKTRISERPKTDEQKNPTPLQPTPVPAVKGAPAPSDAPKPQPSQTTPQPSSTPQQ